MKPAGENDDTLFIRRDSMPGYDPAEFDRALEATRVDLTARDAQITAREQRTVKTQRVIDAIFLLVLLAVALALVVAILTL